MDDNLYIYNFNFFFFPDIVGEKSFFDFLFTYLNNFLLMEPENTNLLDANEKKALEEHRVNSSKDLNELNFNYNFVNLPKSRWDGFLNQIFSFFRGISQRENIKLDQSIEPILESASYFVNEYCLKMDKDLMVDKEKASQIYYLFFNPNEAFSIFESLNPFQDLSCYIGRRLDFEVLAHLDYYLPKHRALRYFLEYYDVVDPFSDYSGSLFISVNELKMMPEAMPLNIFWWVSPSIKSLPYPPCLMTAEEVVDEKCKLEATIHQLYIARGFNYFLPRLSEVNSMYNKSLVNQQIAIQEKVQEYANDPRFKLYENSLSRWDQKKFPPRNFAAFAIGEVQKNMMIEFALDNLPLYGIRSQFMEYFNSILIESELRELASYQTTLERMFFLDMFLFNNMSRNSHPMALFEENMSSKHLDTRLKYSEYSKFMSIKSGNEFSLPIKEKSFEHMHLAKAYHYQREMYYSEITEYYQNLPEMEKQFLLQFGGGLLLLDQLEVDLMIDGHQVSKLQRLGLDENLNFSVDSSINRFIFYGNGVPVIRVFDPGIDLNLNLLPISDLNLNYLIQGIYNKSFELFAEKGVSHSKYTMGPRFSTEMDSFIDEAFIRLHVTNSIIRVLKNEE